MSMQQTDLLETMRTYRIVPVIVLDDAQAAVPLAQALLEGGLPCAEITFRTAAAAEAIRRICAECPDLLVGAGTVLTSKQAAEARAAGARFVVSPGFGPNVIDYCLEHALPIFPGVCTPTEIEMALGKNLNILKFFPAEAAGGVNYLKAIGAPYGGVQFMPTGGINADNLATYLALRNVMACGGSWMAPADWISAGRYDRIREETARAVEIVGPGPRSDSMQAANR
jgi:2-dehydro-3-deoxyphosphogluconate aldolase / (4S)-4-hydroxy-2-oxoglutarate aldolase